MSLRSLLVTCVAVLFWSSQTLAQAAARPLELKWSELSPIISGHVVELVAPGDVSIRGEVVSVREDALLIDVQKTADSKSYPKGSVSIPRAAVNLLRLQRTRSSWGRGIGTVIGVLSGLAVGGYVAGTKTHSAGAGIPVFLGIASGITLAGYYVGRAGDKRVTEIRVVP